MSGIIQATNLQVDNIKHSGGTTGLTIDSSGNVTESNFAMSWWVKTDNTEVVGSGGLTIDDWTEINDSYGFKRVGGAFTVSSGAFTFPSTGLWKVSTQLFFNSNDPSRYVSASIAWASTSMTRYTHIMDSSNDQVYASLSATRYCNVTNTNQTLVLSAASAVNVNIRGVGDGSNGVGITDIVFQRIAPPQS